MSLGGIAIAIGQWWTGDVVVERRKETEEWIAAVAASVQWVIVEAVKEVGDQLFRAPVIAVHSSSAYARAQEGRLFSSRSHIRKAFR